MHITTLKHKFPEMFLYIFIISEKWKEIIYIPSLKFRDFSAKCRFSEKPDTIFWFFSVVNLGQRCPTLQIVYVAAARFQISSLVAGCYLRTYQALFFGARFLDFSFPQAGTHSQQSDFRQADALSSASSTIIIFHPWHFLIDFSPPEKIKIIPYILANHF